MRTLLIAALLFGHTESGVVHVPESGRVVVGYHKFFKGIPKCKAVSRRKLAVSVPVISREWAEIHGTPEDVVEWACRK